MIKNVYHEIDRANSLEVLPMHVSEKRIAKNYCIYCSGNVQFQSITFDSCSHSWDVNVCICYICCIRWETESHIKYDWCDEVAKAKKLEKSQMYLYWLKVRDSDEEIPAPNAQRRLRRFLHKYKLPGVYE